MHSLPNVSVPCESPNVQFSINISSPGPFCGSLCAVGPLPPLTQTASSFTEIKQLRTVTFLHTSMSTPSLLGAGTGLKGARISQPSISTLLHSYKCVVQKPEL